MCDHLTKDLRHRQPHPHHPAHFSFSRVNLTSFASSLISMKIDYPDRIVAFIDILGFRQLVLTAGENPQGLLQELTSLLSANVSKKWSESKGFKIKMFSDCICASAPNTFSGLIMAIVNISNIQQAFLRRKLLLRGGLSFGRHYESRTLIFSEALIKAYTIESSVAVYPRVVLDESLVQRFFGNDSGALTPGKTLANCFLQRDSDGKAFVNYFPSVTHSVEIDKKRRIGLERQKELILDARKNHPTDTSIMFKLSWVERYHNFVVKELNGGDPSLLIGEPNTLGFREVFAGDSRNPQIASTAHL